MLRPGRKQGWEKGPERCVLKAVSKAQWEGTSQVGMSARPSQDCVAAAPRPVSSGCDWASLGPSRCLFQDQGVAAGLPTPPGPVSAVKDGAALPQGRGRLAGLCGN